MSWLTRHETAERRRSREVPRLVVACGRETRWRGEAPCRRPAGLGTGHAGYGPCSAHGDARAHRAWEVAMRLAGELDVGPWEALNLAVRLAAHRVQWTEIQAQRAADAADGDDANPLVMRWLAESRRERALLVKTAKSAIDAGVAERLVRQVELEGRLVADAVGRALDALELSDEQRQLAFSTAHQALLMPSVVDGQVAGG